MKFQHFTFCLDNTVNSSKHGWEKWDFCIKTMPYKQLKWVYQLIKKRHLPKLIWKNRNIKKVISAMHAYTCHFQLSSCQKWLFWMVMWCVLMVFPQNMVHLLPLFFTGGGHSTALIASSNTVFRPRWVSAEHSRYFTAPGKNEKNNAAVSAQTWFTIRQPLIFTTMLSWFGPRSLIKNHKCRRTPSSLTTLYSCIS